MNHSRYSDSDIKVILEQIRLYPDNLKNAFKESGKLINRNEGAITRQYYKVLKHKPSFKAVTVGSKKGFTNNVKNTPRKDGIFPTERKLNKPLWLIQLFLELDEKQQQLVLNVIKD